MNQHSDKISKRREETFCSKVYWILSDELFALGEHSTGIDKFQHPDVAACIPIPEKDVHNVERSELLYCSTVGAVFHPFEGLVANFRKDSPSAACIPV